MNPNNKKKIFYDAIGFAEDESDFNLLLPSFLRISEEREERDNFGNANSNSDVNSNANGSPREDQRQWSVPERELQGNLTFTPIKGQTLSPPYTMQQTTTPVVRAASLTMNSASLPSADTQDLVDQSWMWKENWAPPTQVSNRVPPANNSPADSSSSHTSPSSPPWTRVGKRTATPSNKPSTSASASSLGGGRKLN